MTEDPENFLHSLISILNGFEGVITETDVIPTAKLIKPGQIKYTIIPDAPQFRWE